jgi:hypothetical protein
MVGQGLRGIVETVARGLALEWRVHVVAEQRCWYYGHDACPNSGRAGPPQRLDCMGELDDLMRMHFEHE